MSLLYECIHTVITGGFLEAAGDSSHALAATCVNKLRRFLEDPDQNCKVFFFSSFFFKLLGNNQIIN